MLFDCSLKYINDNMKTTLQLFFLVLCLAIPTKRAYSQTADFSLVGFATENGGTTGGAGGIEVAVSTYADLKKYAETPDTKYIIKIAQTITGTGTVADKNYAGSIRVASNKSIIGVGDKAFLDGVGLTIRNVKNVIIQNIKFSMISIGKAIPPGSEDIPKIYSKLGDEGRAQIIVNGGDLVAISNATNIWIDHCEFFNENPRVQTNQDLYDGLLDITQNSGFITISWCYFHDHHKCNLIGSAEIDLFADRKITFHHNYYKTISSRVPFYRGATGHFFNNYNYDVYGGTVHTSVNACVKVEKNYFENCKKTIFSTSEGAAERIDNKEVNCGTTTYPPACVVSIPYDYSKVLTQNVDDVKTMVTQYAGVGKLSTLSVGDLHKNYKTSAYPNPFHKTTTINSAGAFDYFVYNIAGLEIEKGNATETMKIGEKYNTGVYIVKLSSDNGSSYEKIIKK